MTGLVDPAYDDLIASDANVCIWCMQASESAAVEHVVPESLGGPWTLPGRVVCARCNTTLSHLDRAVADALDVPAFVHGVVGKRGRIKPVASRGNFAADVDGDGPRMRINSGPNAVYVPGNRRLSGLAASPRNISMSEVQRRGDEVSFNINVPLVFDRTAVRGLAKIATEAVAYYLGAAFVYRSEFDQVRAFVRSDFGDRQAILFSNRDMQYRLELNPPVVLPPRMDVVVRFRVAMCEFLVDLSPASTHHPEIVRLADAEWGRGNWVELPNFK